MRAGHRRTQQPTEKRVRLGIAATALLVFAALLAAAPLRAGGQAVDLAQLRQEADQLALQVRNAQARLADLDDEIKAVQVRLTESQAALTEARQQLDARAAAVYMNGFRSAAMSYSVFLDERPDEVQLARKYLDSLQAGATGVLDRVVALTGDARAESEQLAKATAEQHELVGSLSASQQKITAAISRLQAAGSNSAPAQLTYPPNVDAPVTGNGYYRMPDAADPPGTYGWDGGAEADSRCGSLTLLGVIYTVAQRWNALHPDHRLMIGDLNQSVGHVSHRWGADVDIKTEGAWAADTGGSATASIELADLFVDTGAILVIGYDDGAVANAVAAYSAKTGKPGHIEEWPNHAGHFHVRIQPQYKLPLMEHCP